MTTPPYPIHSVTLTAVLDDIDPPLWSLWSCEAVLEDGRVLRDCTVQSDGFAIAYETLEDDLGVPVLSAY